MQALKTEIRNGPLALSLERIGTTTTVSLFGELDLATVSALDEAIEDCRAEQAQAVILDLSALEFIDSTGVVSLVTMSDRLGGGVLLRIVPSRFEAVTRVFELIGLDKSLPFLESRAGSAPRFVR